MPLFFVKKNLRMSEKCCIFVFRKEEQEYEYIISNETNMLY